MCLFFAFVAALTARVCDISCVSPIVSPPPRIVRVQGVHQEPEPELSPASPGSGVLWLRWREYPASQPTGTNLGWHSVSIFKQRWVHYKHPPPTRGPIALCVNKVVSASLVVATTITICLVNVQKKNEVWGLCRNGDSIYLLTLRPLGGLCHLLACNVLWWQQVMVVQGPSGNGSTLIWAQVSIYHSVIVSCRAPVSPLINW